MATQILHRIGVRRATMVGPEAFDRTAHAIGTAVTLQLMPQREDIASGDRQEDIEKLSSLWAVLDRVEAGDILVVQAWADDATGCIGEMLATYLSQRGCQGVVVDGRIRDSLRIEELGLPVWARGATPNFASQAGLFPIAHCVPIGCGGAFVMPGDVIVADADGAVVVPRKLVGLVSEIARDLELIEAFSRERLAAGGDIARYYPISEEAAAEYAEWRASKSPER